LESLGSPTNSQEAGCITTHKLIESCSGSKNFVVPASPKYRYCQRRSHKPVQASLQGKR
jgi:hypothetical protein